MKIHNEKKKKSSKNQFFYKFCMQNRNQSFRTFDCFYKKENNCNNKKVISNAKLDD